MRSGSYRGLTNAPIAASLDMLPCLFPPSAAYVATMGLERRQSFVVQQGQHWDYEVMRTLPICLNSVVFKIIVEKFS